MSIEIERGNSNNFITASDVKLDKGYIYEVENKDYGPVTFSHTVGSTIVFIRLLIMEPIAIGYHKKIRLTGERISKIVLSYAE